MLMRASLLPGGARSLGPDGDAQLLPRNYPRPPYRESAWPRAKVPVPVLMIHGLEDPFLLPGALDGTWEWVETDLTLVTVPGAGHWVHHDAADLVTRSIRAWLAR